MMLAQRSTKALRPFAQALRPRAALCTPRSASSLFVANREQPSRTRLAEGWAPSRRAFSSTSSQRGMEDLVNIIQSSPNDPVAITSLTPNAGFTLTDGLVLPSPIILCPGGCFMWDVAHPTKNGADEMGREWDGWNEEKLRLFEVLNPRPEILLIGTGSSTLLAPQRIKRYLNGLGIQVDVLDSVRPSSQPLLQRSRDKRIALPVRVEPKVFFANERTFLSWLNFTVVLGGLAVGLLNFGDRVGKISAGMFTFVARLARLTAFPWSNSLVTYHWRANAIRKRGSGPYDDRLVVTNFILRFAA
ncbi:Vacuolar transporter chaperone 1 [Rhodotorula toruloides]|nr:Vacuolar transporter chaperone 1 [Rhodotorula toruloides]